MNFLVQSQNMFSFDYKPRFISNYAGGALKIFYCKSDLLFKKEIFSDYSDFEKLRGYPNYAKSLLLLQKKNEKYPNFAFNNLQNKEFGLTQAG